MVYVDKNKMLLLSMSHHSKFKSDIVRVIIEKDPVQLIIIENINLWMNHDKEVMMIWDQSLKPSKLLK